MKTAYFSMSWLLSRFLTDRQLVMNLVHPSWSGSMGAKDSNGNPAGLIYRSQSDPSSEGIVYTALNYRVSAVSVVPRDIRVRAESYQTASCFWFLIPVPHSSLAEASPMPGFWTRDSLLNGLRSTSIYLEATRRVVSTVSLVTGSLNLSLTYFSHCIRRISGWRLDP